MTAARVLIVDDEPPARRRLVRLTEAHPELELVGEAADGERAVAMIRERSPDLVFLDVQMPELDGFEVLESLEQPPKALIFVTAHESHAVDAFGVRAADYLLKPFTPERFQQAAEAALARLRTLDQQSSSLRATERPLQRFVVRRGARDVVVPVADVEWIEGSGAYVRLHTGSGSHLLRRPLKQVEAELDARAFLRVHRSAIVRIDRIESMAPRFHGEVELFLRSGARVKLSRSYRAALQKIREGR
ncbi:MAG: LytTR family DNA-binding domain-containing protein [Acidobacteriota bacterium]